MAGGTVGMAGSGRVALLAELTFPFEITYTEQKSGAPFNTLPGTSGLNILQKTNF